MGLFENDLIVRLPNSQSRESLPANSANLLGHVPGCPIREYVAIRSAPACTKNAFVDWVAKSRECGTFRKPNIRASKQKIKDRQNQRKGATPEPKKANHA